MAFPKSNLYPKDDQALSGFARAMGHPARPAIILQLAVEGEACVENMTRNHPISQAAMSDHLSILRESHLVKYKEQYPFTFYRLDEKNLDRAEAYLKNFFDKLRAAKEQKRQKGRRH
jgi:ArsR family transcriptional regulator